MPIKKIISNEVDINTLNLLPIAVALFDNKKVYFLNKKAAELFQISQKQLKENSFSIFQFLDKQQHTEVKKNNLKILKGEKLQASELLFKTYKNKSIYIEATSNCVLFENKKVIQTTFIEISELKQKKVELEKSKDLLVETKNKFDLITNGSNDIIAFYTYQPVEKYFYVSPNITRILGYEPNELLNDYNFFAKRIIGDQSEFNRIDKVVKGYQKRNIKKNYDYTYKTLKKNNEEVWLENNLTPITDEKGKIIFYLNIFRDITIQKEKEIELQQHYLNYRNLLDTSPAAYIIHKEGVTMFCNKAILKLLQLKSEKQILGKFTLDFFVKEDRIRAMKNLKDVYEGSSNKKYNYYTICDSKGNLIEAEMKSIKIKFNNLNCVLTLVNNITEQRQFEKEKIKSEVVKANNEFLLLEVKERQETEKKLLEKTAYLSSIFESSNHLIWTVNKNFEITSYNKNFADNLIRKYNIKIYQGINISTLVTKNKDEYSKFWHAKYKEAFNGKKLEFEKEQFETDEKRFEKVYINPIYDDANEIKEISCIAHDISDTKAYEKKLINQSAKLVAIFESSHHYIWTINSYQKLTSFNKNYFDLISAIYDTQPCVGFELDRGVLNNDKAYIEILDYNYKRAYQGYSTNFEIEIADKNFTKIYLEVFLNPVYNNHVIEEVSGIAHNITEKKLDRQRIEQSLKEKEVLLKEVHHRVKNNMQIISSILNLQSSYVTDNYTLDLLKESQNRIKTMAYIHDSLYQNKSFTSVNFSEYIQTLSKNIIQSYVVSSEKIELIINSEKINLNLDVSIPAGLIVNELITNAIKHAFPGSRRGKIKLNLHAENNNIFIDLKDDGVGTPTNIDYANTNSLGLQLVNTLVDQLDGEIKFKSEKDKGTEVLIKFKT